MKHLIKHIYPIFVILFSPWLLASCTSANELIEIESVNNSNPIVLGAQPETIDIEGTSFSPTVLRNMGCGESGYYVTYDFDVQFASNEGETAGLWFNLGEVEWSSETLLIVTPAEPLPVGTYWIKVLSPDGEEAVWGDLLIVSAQSSDTDSDTETETDTDSDLDTETDTNTESETESDSELDTEPYTVIIQEYEKGFCKAEGTIDNAHFGYTGYGYSNTENMTGVIMEWAVYGGTNASFNFEWRYANMEINRPASVLINGITEVTNVNFESTLEWTNWTILNTDVNLNAGNNIIQLKATSTSGLANIDYLKISGPGANAGTCSTDTMPIPSLP